MFSLLTLLLCQCCDLVHSLYLQQKPLQDHQNDSHFDSATIKLPLDHFNATDNRTFSNRFWANTTFYQPGGPVFFYDAGERGVSDTSSLLSSPSHPLMELTKSLNGIAVWWEHRFYGLSSPFPQELEGTQDERQEAYRYLNTEQALEDAVYFASHFQPAGLEEVWDDLRPNATPWIWIGGSYPGQRGAMIRRRNPDVFFASWSSSTNVEIRINLPEYYLHIAHDLPESCRETIQAAVQYVDKMLEDGSRLAKYKLKWAIARRWPTDTTSYFDRVMYALTAPDFAVAGHLQGLIAANWQSQGLKGRMSTTCAAISPANFTTNTHAAINIIFDAIEANNRHFAPRNSANNHDAQTWGYQVCTEYFYFRTAAPKDPHNILSSLLTTENIWANSCARLFPWLTPPSGSDVVAPARYAGWDKNVSRVMFTTGLRDPWQDVSMVPSMGLVPGWPRHRTMTETIPACDEELSGDEVFGLLFEEGRHCSDLVPGSKNAGKSTELFEKALRKWLPCFKQ